MPAKAKGARRASPPSPASSVEWYPLRFREIFRKKLWGGSGLSKLLRKKCPARTGESWELGQLGRDESVACTGPFKGWPLSKILEHHRRELLGEEHYMKFHDRFPLLVKFLSIEERLSLQVHPSDDFAQRYEAGASWKMEAWYILHAPKEARVVRGVLPGTTLAEFRQHLSAGTIDQCLNVMEVEPGDVVFIPPGTIHTAYGGLVVLEVQQASDATYRLTDWGRRDFNGRLRQLGVDKAMGVMDFYSMGVSKFRPTRIPEYSYHRKLLIKCEKFAMEAIELTGKKRIPERSDPERFLILTVVRGKGRFCFGPRKRQSVPFGMGETFLIPARLGEYDIAPQGVGEIVCTYIT